MRVSKLVLWTICLFLLLSLCACVAVHAGDREEETKPDQQTAAADSSDLHFEEKTPMEEFTQDQRGVLEGKKDIGPSENYSISTEEDDAPGEIPLPEPVEPPLEVQSESMQAENE